MQRGFTAGFPKLTRGVKRLLLLLVAVFVAQLIYAGVTGFDSVAYQRGVPRLFGLRLDGLLSGFVWQPLTYMLLHSVDGWGHLVSNAIGLYFLGTAVEERTGEKGLYRLALGSGLAGAAAVLAVQAFGVATGRWAAITVVGASGAVSGIVGVFCYVFWDRWLYFFFIRLQGRHLLALFLVVEAVRGVQGIMGTANVAVHCHLGGLAFGLAWANGWTDPRNAWRSLKHWWLVRKHERVKRKLKVIQGGDRDEREFLN